MLKKEVQENVRKELTKYKIVSLEKYFGSFSLYRNKNSMLKYSENCYKRVTGKNIQTFKTPIYMLQSILLTYYISDINVLH